MDSKARSDSVKSYIVCKKLTLDFRTSTGWKWRDGYSPHEISDSYTYIRQYKLQFIICHHRPSDKEGNCSKQCFQFIIHTLNFKTPKYIKQTLTELKREIDSAHHVLVINPLIKSGRQNKVVKRNNFFLLLTDRQKGIAEAQDSWWASPSQLRKTAQEE
jgi:hypothetical protein